MNRTRVVELATGVLVAVLFTLSLAGTYVAVQEGTGVVSALLGVYLTGMLVAAVALDAMRARWWRIAFFAGVAVWGGYEYATTGGAFAAVLAAMGLVMVAASLWGEG
ncbi:hypothetical protein NGM10_12660 [Halorussus salilacus]|uniref:hypothetical protein n=1 Tax=Halorussus salilacus TaxID=2953750 RepID=UPI00209F231D|nr:hypothetical protein [Halorussus salilacus]USZ67575.1 hypothetical protein NGM10_12660 [Halorussus salilacus]